KVRGPPDRGCRLQLGDRPSSGHRRARTRRPADGGRGRGRRGRPGRRRCRQAPAGGAAADSPSLRARLPGLEAVGQLRWLLRCSSWAALAVTMLTACSIRTCNPRPQPSTPSPSPSVTTSAGNAVALKATATITFQAANFNSTYKLESRSNPENTLTLSA